MLLSLVFILSCEVYHKVKPVKIITWNVNGWRAALRKGALDWAWGQSPDMLCLQEVKARPDQLTEAHAGSLPMPFAWNPARRPGYSGVTTFFKEQPREIQLGMGNPVFDEEGRVISTLHAGFRLFNVYFPSGQRGKDRARGAGWRLDYFLVSKTLIDRVEDVIIHDEVQGSDHCPVELILS
jgi:exodeoxyribonuclease-3